MKCRHFFSFVLVVLLSLFFGSFITTNNSFAVEDYSISAPAFTSVVICDDNNSKYPNCSDYSFVKVENSGDSLSSCDSSAGPVFNYASYGGLATFDPIIFSISSNSRIYVYNYTGMNSCANSGSYSFSYTLISSLSSSTPPSGDISITSNGIYDVSSYASATVDVPAEVVQGDYHDDLVSIQKSIIVCGAILLVLYFFYCIYRLIIKNSGVH